MKCKDCFWLSGKKTAVGKECMNPENQKRWAGQINHWAYRDASELPARRFKKPSQEACKRFKPVVPMTDCQWK